MASRIRAQALSISVRSIGSLSSSSPASSVRASADTYNDVQGQQGDNAESIRRDIAGILHTLNQAYDNLYNNLLSDVALDVSSEIAALQGMMANDGLTGEALQ